MLDALDGLARQRTKTAERTAGVEKGLLAVLRILRDEPVKFIGDIPHVRVRAVRMLRRPIQSLFPNGIITNGCEIVGLQRTADECRVRCRQTWTINKNIQIRLVGLDRIAEIQHALLFPPRLDAEEERLGDRIVRNLKKTIACGSDCGPKESIAACKSYVCVELFADAAQLYRDCSPCFLVLDGICSALQGIFQALKARRAAENIEQALGRVQDIPLPARGIFDQLD